MGIRLNGNNINLNTIKKVRVDGNTVYQAEPERDYFCVKALSSTTFAFTASSALTTYPTLSYKLNNGYWNSYTIGDSLSLSTGDRCYFRGNNSTFSISSSQYIRAESTGSNNIELSGNIMSLVDETCESLTIPCDYCFKGLFYGFRSTTTCPKLPATNLTQGCYDSMFGNCGFLTSVPNLPATIIPPEAYSEMFKYCSNLIVSDSWSASSMKSWRVPTTDTIISAGYGAFGNTFVDCAGARSTDNMNVSVGGYKTYYTKYNPV